MSRLAIRDLESRPLVLLAVFLGGFAGLLSASEPHHPVNVVDNVVMVASLPDFRLVVVDDFEYLGSTSFSLGGRSDADVFFFAEMNGDSVERLVKVQFESLTDDAAKDYNWEGEDTLQVGEAEYLLGFWCFDAAEVALERPASDTAITQAWLAEEHHRQTGVFVGTRLARVFNDGRSEVLVFYGETARLTGIDCDDEDGAMVHLPAIIGRSEAAFDLAPPTGR